MRRLPRYLAVFLCALAVAGCSGQRAAGPITSVEVEEVAAVEGLAGEELSASSTGLGDDGDISGRSLAQVGGGDLLKQRVVYFEYNSSLLSELGKAVVKAHAQYLAATATRQVILEGHADERGTREYNLALAEDRALTVAKVMQALGVRSARIQTVSYGEERPVSLAHDENAWRLNRRVEILHQ